ncbi:oxidoreductase [Thermaerobacillus caldiproteolyticus]|uniref:oxidoreductase n=1 Tax=Thermaerobacillus caldiproteolyticus TaxID=247480 RepID=UPI00188DBAF1|nr:oxidoreductase [Anoxybacillus caldiproteolyticus]QPA31834.1 oxidoreductase [Anoxybacillus caldiproteolyticus]
MEGRTALLIGASGLVGSELLTLLLESDIYRYVTIFVRRELPIKHRKLQQVVVDFNELESYEHYFHVDDVFSCLGTTMKKAKTKQQFIKVDYEYTMRAAALAEKCDVKSFLMVSSLGANPRSPFFYNRVKGETEEALKQLTIKSLHIFRPSLLLGKRQEFRLAEKLAEWLLSLLPFLFIGKWRKYKPVEAKKVALAMFYAATSCQKGIYIYESDHISHIS